MSAAVVTDLLTLCVEVYQASDRWTFGTSSGVVLAAERALRDTLDRNPPAIAEHSVIADARRVHAAGGFHFDRPVSDEYPDLQATEAAWGARVRAHLANNQAQLVHGAAPHTGR